MFAPITQDPRLLHATGAVPVTNGQIGGPGGAAGDTQLLQVIILKNAGPAILTIAGFRGEDNTARNIVLSGSTTADTVYNFAGLKNSGAPMTLTASVADTCLVAVVPA
jgi:hypothetical protein